MTHPPSWWSDNLVQKLRSIPYILRFAAWGDSALCDRKGLRHPWRPRSSRPKVWWVDIRRILRGNSAELRVGSTPGKCRDLCRPIESSFRMAKSMLRRLQCARTIGSGPHMMAASRRHQGSRSRFTPGTRSSVLSRMRVCAGTITLVKPGRTTYYSEPCGAWVWITSPRPPLDGLPLATSCHHRRKCRPPSQQRQTGRTSAMLCIRP